MLHFVCYTSFEPIYRILFGICVSQFSEMLFVEFNSMCLKNKSNFEKMYREI